MDQKQTQHAIGLMVSLIGIALFVFFGKGPVLYGALMGFGMFATILLVALKTPSVLKWAYRHCALTEIITTGGTFLLFSFFASGTVTAGIASAIVCLLVSAVLGCAKLGFLDRLIGQAVEGAADGAEKLFGKEEEPEEQDEMDIAPRRVKVRMKRPTGNQILKAAMARAVAKGA